MPDAARLERKGRGLTVTNTDRPRGPQRNGVNQVNAHKRLPATWVWTRRAFGPDACLYECRDTRWPATVPGIVASSEADAIRQARECHHEAHRKTTGLPRPGYKCGVETYGGGCFNCGWNPERAS